MDFNESYKVRRMFRHGARLAHDGDEIREIIDCQENCLVLKSGLKIPWEAVEVNQVLQISEAYHPAREVLTEKRVDGDTTYHPSQGLIRFGRITGGADLFDSRINHQHYVSLTISTARVKKGRSGRIIMAEDRLIEVNMSEVQFSRAITNMTSASGVPVTLHRIDGVRVPGPLKRETLPEKQRERMDEAKRDIRDMVKEPLKVLRELREEKKRPTLKQVDTLIADLETTASNVGANAEFVHTLLEENMETLVAECKTEVDGYVHTALLVAGIESVGDMVLIGEGE